MTEEREHAALVGMLQAKALRHLARYATSRAHLAMLLRRHARKYAPEQEDPGPAIEQVLDRCVELGWQNDARFADVRLRRLHGEGRSTMAIRAHMAQQGVGRELVEVALEALAGEAGDRERVAAINFARRRRLGPYRAAEARAERRERDLAAMCRAGFPLQLARQVIDARSVEALSEED